MAYKQPICQRRLIKSIGVLLLRAVITFSVVWIPPVIAAPEAEPWSHIPRGELTRIWSWGTKELPSVGWNNSTGDIEYPRGKAELIKDATVENSGGFPTCVAATDSGYVFVHDAARGCILRWNPEGEIDKVLWCETEMSELEAAVYSGNPEVYEPMMECAACCGINGMIAKGENIYLQHRMGKAHRTPWGSKTSHWWRPPLHFGFKEMRYEGDLISQWWRQWKWYDADPFIYGTPWPDWFDVDRDANVHVVNPEARLGIVSYNRQGLVLRRVMFARDEIERYYMDPDGPVAPKGPGGLLSLSGLRSKAEHERRVREERRLRVQDIAREVAAGSPPLEIRYAPELKGPALAFSAKENGDFLLIGSEGRIFRIGTDLEIKAIRMKEHPRGIYRAFIHRGVILLVPSEEPGLWFMTERGEYIGRLGKDDRPTFPRMFAVDASWNIFMVTYLSPTIRKVASELYIYRPDEDLLPRLHAAESKS